MRIDKRTLLAKALSFQRLHTEAVVDRTASDDDQYQVSTQLSTLLSNDTVDVEKLEGLLKENRGRVKETSFSYTVIPSNGLTELLCDVAQYVVQERRKSDPSYDVTPLQLLIPDFATSPMLQAIAAGPLATRFIKDQVNVGELLRALDTEQTHQVCEAFKSAFSLVITGPIDVVIVLQLISPEKCSAFLTAIQPQLDSILCNRKQFMDILRSIDPEKYSAFLTAIQGRLPELLDGVTAVVDVLRNCNFDPEKGAAFLTAIQGQLREFITSSSEVVNVLYNIEPIMCPTFLTAIQKQLLNFLRYRNDTVISKLINPNPVRRIDRFVTYDTEKVKIVFSFLKPWLPMLIKTQNEINDICKSLPPAEQSDPIFTVCSQLFALKQNSLGANGKDIALERCLADIQDCYNMAVIKPPTTMSSIEQKVKDAFVGMGSPQNKAVNEQIAVLRNTVTKWSVGKNKDADKLEKEVFNCPPSQRGALLTKPSVQKILGAKVCQRLCQLCDSKTTNGTPIPPQVAALNAQIAILRGGITCCSIGKNRDAIKLEKALADCPDDKKNEVLKLPEVRKILGARRCEALIEQCRKTTVMLGCQR